MTKAPFAFTDENLTKAKAIIAKYPEKRERSAILALLDLAQRQNNNYLSHEAIEYVADFLETPYIRAYEIATFYTMFNLKPVGRYHIQLCGTTPCWLSGASDVMNACKKELGINEKETTKDGLFTLSEVECIGACVNAPVAQINDDYYEDLSPEIMVDLIKKLRNGDKITPGSQIGRMNSAAKEGA